MDLSEYVGKYVKIELINSHYFKGRVLEVDDNSIKIKDIKNKIVTLTPQSILFIQEVSNGN